MSRGESCGGGQSSLGYLFGSEEQPTPPRPLKTVPPPPYGVDIETDQKPPDGGAPPTNQNVSNRSSHPRVQGQHLGNLVTDRPSTKVKSVPGGVSSLGYLFGDK